jgi:hypothetical protein
MIELENKYQFKKLVKKIQQKMTTKKTRDNSDCFLN